MQRLGCEAKVRGSQLVRCEMNLLPKIGQSLVPAARPRANILQSQDALG